LLRARGSVSGQRALRSVLACCRTGSAGGPGRVAPMANDRGLRGQVLDVLRRSDEPLNDDEIAAIVGANRHYVNTLCRDLAVTGVIVRSRGPAGKLANSMPSAGGSSAGSPKPDAVLPDRPRRRRAASAPNGNHQDLMAGFPRPRPVLPRAGDRAPAHARLGAGAPARPVLPRVRLRRAPPRGVCIGWGHRLRRSRHSSPSSRLSMSTYASWTCSGPSASRAS
jgi:hypothetical protein